MTKPHQQSSMREFVEEVLGIDGRGIRLMLDVFVRPRDVFSAFLEGDQTKYAPPIRVWLWVFGVKTAVLLLIGGAGGMFSRINDAQRGKNFADLLERFDVELDQFVGLANSWWNIFHPLLVLILSIPAALALAWINRAKPFASHANVYLSANLAASIVSFATVPTVLLAAPGAAGLLGFVNIAVFGLTFARGGAAGPYFATKAGAIGKTFFVSVVFFLTTMIASLILMIAFIAFANSSAAG